MTLSRTSWIIILSIYLIIVSAILVYASTTFAVGTTAYNTTHQQFGNSFASDIIVSVQILPTTLNLIFLVLPSAIIVLLLIWSILPTTNAGT